jgi:hypothetical protein
VQGPRPQPDYSVGFRRSAFTDKQLNRLDQLIGSVYDTSFFAATYQMRFPFLTCEVKCGAAALDVADRQNAHSMTLAVRGVVELYKAVKREKELHREILAFSISHDHRSVRIYGHYAVIDQLPPDLNFEVSQGSELQFAEASGLSQELNGLLSEQSNVESASRTSQEDSELAPITPLTDTPDTSVSQGKEQAALKRPKRKHTGKQPHEALQGIG